MEFNQRSCSSPSSVYFYKYYVKLELSDEDISVDIDLSSYLLMKYLYMTNNWNCFHSSWLLDENLCDFIAAIPLSIDHKPDRSDERQRIEEAGGFVIWAGEYVILGCYLYALLYASKGDICFTFPIWIEIVIM